MTLVTLAVVFAYFTHPDGGSQAGHDHLEHGTRARPQTRVALLLKSYGFWRSTVILLSAIPIAILTNALRVSGTGVLAHYYGTKVADGFFHSFSGWVVYIVAFLILFGVGWILDRTKPASENPDNGQADRASRELSSAVGISPTKGAQFAQAEGTE
jgi:exosortase/archaeosortase family protein